MDRVFGTPAENDIEREARDSSDDDPLRYYILSDVRIVVEDETTDLYHSEQETFMALARAARIIKALYITLVQHL